MRILVLNWRCPRNPRAGGAERMTQEVAKRLVARGDQVEWFSSAFAGAAAEENIDGVRIVRQGHQWTVHWHAFRRYHRRLLGRFDVVVDQVNTVPFFTPLWADIPRVMFIHQLAREVWWYESPFPLNVVGFAAEPWYLRIYRGTSVITVSRSTERDLRNLGFHEAITIIPQGVEPVGLPQTTREKIPTFLYVGRLSPSKRVADVVKAFSLFLNQSPGQLWIAGDGPSTYLNYLVGLIKRLRLTHVVRFWGSVSNEDKHALMARAHALILASAREGWGLVVTEANACGTPAIAYDVPGLRDSVQHRETGILVKPVPSALAEGMLGLEVDGDEYKRLATNARRWSSTFSYETTTDTVRRAIAPAHESHSAQVQTWSP